MEETGKTENQIQDVRSLRQGIAPLDMDDGLAEDDVVKIRDAVTDKTIVSVTEARNIREAANQLQMDEDLDDMVKIRDAMTDKTIVSVTEARSVREAADQMEMDFPEEIFDDSFIEESIEDHEEEEPDYEEPDYEEPDYEEPPVRPVKKEKRRSRREEEYHYDRYERRERDRRRIDYYDRDYDAYEDGYYDYDREYRDDRPRKSPLRFIPLVLVLALCVLVFIAARTICFDNPVNPSDYSRIKYTVTEETTTESLAQDLLNLGLIDNPLVFRLRTLFYSAKYVPGEYELSPSFSTEKIVNILSGYNYGEEE